MSEARENRWIPSDRSREPSVLMKPIHEPAAWYASDIANSDRWVYRMSDAEIAEVLDAVAAIEEEGIDLMSVTRERFPLPHFAEVLDEIRAEVMQGRGFAVIGGLPVESRTRVQTAIAFWGIGAHFGHAIAQNKHGHLLGHVKDIGGDYSKVRGYMTREEMKFHTDRADILSLCCLHPAKSGGAHRIVSSVTLYNEMLKGRPDLVKELAWPFYRSRQGEIPPGETEPWYRQPVFSFTDGYFACRGPGAPLFKAQGMPGVPDLTAAQREAIDVFMKMAGELSLDIDFEVGDISFVQNHVTLHARTDFEDYAEPERKRHLLRLWLSTDGERPLDASIANEIQGVPVDDNRFETPLDVV